MHELRVEPSEIFPQHIARFVHASPPVPPLEPLEPLEPPEPASCAAVAHAGATHDCEHEEVFWRHAWHSPATACPQFEKHAVSLHAQPPMHFTNGPQGPL